MSEMKFDEARINAWKKEIDAEFDAVERVLKDVTDEITRDPFEGDVVMEAFYEAGKKMEESWGELKRVFDSVKDLADSLFANTKRAIQEAREKADAFKSKIKN